MKKLFLMIAVVVALAGCNSSTNVTNVDYTGIAKTYLIYPKNYTIVVDTVYADSLMFTCHFDVKAIGTDTITENTTVTFDTRKYQNYSINISETDYTEINFQQGMYGVVYTPIPATNSIRYYISYSYSSHHSNFNQYANLDSVYRCVSVVNPIVE